MNYFPVDNGDEWERADEEYGFLEEEVEESSKPSKAKMTPEQKKSIKFQKEIEQYRANSIESYLYVSDPYHLRDFDALVELAKQQKQIKSQIDVLRNKIKSDMISCKCSRAINLEKGYQLTISKPRNNYNTYKEFDLEKFKAENPELYKKYLITSYSNKSWSNGGNLILKSLSEKQVKMYESEELSQYFVRPNLPTPEGYIPACPQGYRDCVCDPAYIHFHYSNWYKELYGDLTPEEAAKEHCRIDDEFCYDDEDK